MNYWLSSRFLLFQILLACCYERCASCFGRSANCASANNAVSCDPCIDRNRVKIGCVHHGIPAEDVFWQSMDSAIAQGAKDMGIDLVYDPITNLTLSEEDEPSIEDYMSKKIRELCAEGTALNGIFVTLPSSSIVPALNTCKEANLPVIVFNAGLVDAKSNGYLFVGQNETEAGYDAGDNIAKVNGTNTFCCVDHAPGVNVLQERCGGFGDGLAANGITAFANVVVNPNNCTSFEEALVESCSPSDGNNWSSVGLYLGGEPDHKCGVEFLRKHAEASAVASDVSDYLYAGMTEGLNILFGIDQQAYLQGYYPNSFLTLAATNNQILQNEILKTGPKLVTKPPSEHYQQCNANGYAVCPKGESGSSNASPEEAASTTSSALSSKRIFVPFSIGSFISAFALLAFVV